MGVLSGSVAMVTGAAGGLGKSFCETLLKGGAKVCLVDCDKVRGEAVRRELAEQYGSSNVTFKQCDVTSRVELEDSFKHTISSFGGIDILINNAGILDESQHSKMISLNLGAVIEGTFLGIEYMDKDQGGRGGVIINTASAAGVCPVGFAAAYSATKYGVVGFTLSMKDHVKGKKNGVRVNCVCPTGADTEILHLKHDNNVSNKAMFDRYFSSVALMHPRQVAEAIIPLIEDKSLTGAVLLCESTGPRLLRLPTRLQEIPSKM